MELSNGGWGGMAAPIDIPDIVIGRLPIYLRALSQLAAEGHEITSSHELGQRLGISSAQIRKDLSHFGEFGKQGTGYQITHLLAQLKQILQVDKEWAVVLVGAGDLGHAIAHYAGFVERGFRIIGVFDNSPEKIGKALNGLKVRESSEMEQVIRDANVKIAMVATPARVAQQVADQLVKAGIRAILNYAPITLVVPENVHVQYIDPVAHLQRMTYYLG
jgi:redox-sensing transcriptional repressor